MREQVEEKNQEELVLPPAPELSIKQRKFLRGLAHSLKPVVFVGKAGLTEGVTEQINIALFDHELIKVKVQKGVVEDTKALSDAIAEANKAAAVQRIGRVMTFYRPHPKKATITLP